MRKAREEVKSSIWLTSASRHSRQCRAGRPAPCSLPGASFCGKSPARSAATATVTGASLASQPASKMLCRRRGKGVRNRRAGNNLPLGRVGLIHLLLLEKNRPDSRNGCGSREMRLTEIEFTVMLSYANCLVSPEHIPWEYGNF